MASERNFISVPLEGRDVRDLESRVHAFPGAGPVTESGPPTSTTRMVTVRIPSEADARAQVLRIVKEWRDEGKEPDRGE